MPIPFVGPSYQLDSRPASVQRTINLIPVPIEPGNETSNLTFKDLPGLTVFASLPPGPLRGGINANGRAFVVSASTLYEIFPNGTYAARGSLSSASGAVEFTVNTTQLALTDGQSFYVMPLASNILTAASGAPNSPRIGFVDQYILGIDANTQTFQWSKLGNASAYDPLAFASAEGAPDNLNSMVIDHREVWLFGSATVEVWVDVGPDAIFSRSPSAFIEVGCAATQSAQKLDNGVVWLGQNDRGGGVVYRTQGYTPVRISTRALEEALAGLDLSGARAYTYQQDGSDFYCLNVPGLNTTWVFDAMSSQWHERAELVDGAYQKHRGTFHVYAFGKHLLGADDGKLYEMRPDAHDNAGSVLVRDRISPHYRVPGNARVPFSSFELICDKGYGGACLLRYSDDGGAQWGNWHQISLGAIGDRTIRAKLNRCGSARDRVWHVRCTDPVPFNPMMATVGGAS